MTESLLKPNIPLLRRILVQIDAHPELYNQRVFANACGSSHCVAGWALELNGEHHYDVHREIYVDSADRAVDPGDTAAAILGISLNQAWQDGDNPGLFSPRITRAEIQAIAERLAAQAGEEL